MRTPSNDPLTAVRTSVRTSVLTAVRHGWRKTCRVARAMSAGQPGAVGLMPAVLIVGLALGLMLWALPAQEVGARSTLQSLTMPSHLSSPAER